jgi:hypothetical protein
MITSGAEPNIEVAVQRGMLVRRGEIEPLELIP